MTFKMLATYYRLPLSWGVDHMECVTQVYNVPVFTDTTVECTLKSRSFLMLQLQMRLLFVHPTSIN